MNNIERQLIELLQQEQESQFRAFTSEKALRLGLFILEGAEREGKSVTIDIARNGQMLFHYAMPGTSADNDAWIERKERVVNR